MDFQNLMLKKLLGLTIALIFSTIVYAQDKSLVHLISASENSFNTKKVPEDVQKSSLDRIDEKFVRWIDELEFVNDYYSSLIKKGYSPCDYKIGNLIYFDNGYYSKVDTFYFVNKPKGIIVSLMKSVGNRFDENKLYITSKWYSSNMRLHQKSQPEYEFENYFLPRISKEFDFKLISETNTDSRVSITDTEIGTLKLERLIINNITPTGNKIATKYNDKLWRLINWRESTNKIYKYSLEKMNLLGYEFVNISVNDGAHKTYVYRNCIKGLVFEVTEWFSEGIISLNLNWYDKSIKNRIGSLIYCDLK
ncbi:hypothetical protein [Pedobacter sp. Hv1]|uniref:hypothetical protein n=1 Tax=Pedobacter sp. Hv1 TaxID=1740090 RepID=UPI0006D89A3A|nr:hypothetical protein [Pedobacter sp. Hv1]KQC00687.1 hypothetical protein AQF98_08385 [Pedobacter sp. Hv1]